MFINKGLAQGHEVVLNRSVRLLQVPLACSAVPEEILNPANQWGNQGEFNATLAHLADLYQVCTAWDPD